MPSSETHAIPNFAHSKNRILGTRLYVLYRLDILPVANPGFHMASIDNDNEGQKSGLHVLIIGAGTCFVHLYNDVEMERWMN